MFSPEDIQARIREQPFVPLRVVTSSGQNCEVHHPEMIMVGRRSLMIGTASAENPTQYDQTNRVAIIHVTALEDLPTPKRSNGDGRQPA